MFGQYVLTKEVFETLKEDIDSSKLESGEIQLTGALETVRSRTGMVGYVVSGKSYDVGLPEKYYETMMAFIK